MEGLWTHPRTGTKDEWHHAVVDGRTLKCSRSQPTSFFPVRHALRWRAQAIFKSGDDVRQDQLVVQMVAVMGRLLMHESLDLRLTPYRVLASGQNPGRGTARAYRGGERV